MPLKQILQQVVNAVPGGQAAMFLDQEGEAVVVTDSALPPYDLQVIGAYSGIFLSNARRVCEEVSLGVADQVKIECGDSNLYIAALKDGYYIVLVLGAGSNEGLAWRQLLAARERLNEEI